VLTEKEDQKSILMIGGIKVVLPYSPVESSVCVANVAIAEGQLTVSVIEEEEEKTLMFSPIEEEHADKVITPWEKELEMLEDWLNHPELVVDWRE
jgi:hypothetical protein